MILALNNSNHSTHAYYYPFNKVMVYLEFGGDFRDISSIILDTPEMNELTNCQRKIVKLDLATCREQWEARERFLEYNDIFPVKSIRHEG